VTEAKKDDTGKPDLSLLSGAYLHVTSPAYRAIVHRGWDKAWDFGRGDLLLETERVLRTLAKHVPVEAVAAVMLHGAIRYGRSNWVRGFEWSRLAAAFRRHVALGQVDMKAPRVDPDSGLPHLAHAVCMLMFLRDHVAHGLGNDDRGLPTGGKDA
jgi:hypothetical protein